MTAPVTPPSSLPSGPAVIARDLPAGLLPGAPPALVSSLGSCRWCGGTGFVRYDVPRHDPRFGKSTHCAHCADFLKLSRLRESEKVHSLADIKPLEPIHAVAVYMARQLLAVRQGWLWLWGNYGSGKSLVLTGLIADAARSGRLARYYNGGDLMDLCRKDFDNGNGPKEGAGFESLVRVPVLAIDEIAHFHTSSDWYARRLVALMEERFRDAGNGHITIVALNPDPVDWTHGAGDFWREGGPSLLSRMNDGRFISDWPPGMPRPADLASSPIIPGVLRFDAPDVRPHLRRGVQ